MFMDGNARYIAFMGFGKQTCFIGGVAPCRHFGEFLTRTWGKMGKEMEGGSNVILAWGYFTK